ncbi:MAG: CBS domain-containing protein [Phaeodactylibacter sp.]|nr:CBS domain-containing protein [Phaeodactylibacter sp.]MCB9302561.1 CBS domain-containing protein [Lewinellaceae bacterium]HQU59256.1 CBS domain-containing protein [Saprospiraceae bacterium]
MNPDKAIRDIMTTKLVTVTPDRPAKAIQEIFGKNDFHHIPVVEKGERLIGIISKEDLFKVVSVLSLQNPENNHTERELNRLNAADIMTKYPISLDPDDTIGLAADIFLANKFHALPIVEDDKLVGLITTHDLLKFGFNSPVIEKEEEAFEEEA